MYSPKIRPDLVQELYFIRLNVGKPMTKITNSILEKGIKKMKQTINKQKKEKQS